MCWFMEINPLNNTANSMKFARNLVMGNFKVITSKSFFY